MTTPITLDEHAFNNFVQLFLKDRADPESQSLFSKLTATECFISGTYDVQGSVTIRYVDNTGICGIVVYSVDLPEAAYLEQLLFYREHRV
jgi:hypothetical protein